MAKLIRDTQAAARLGVPLREILALVDRGELTGYGRDERVWLDDDEVTLLAGRAANTP